MGYQDADGDGFGNPAAPTSACVLPGDYVSDATDCDDANSSSNPDADELCGDGIDNDCDGAIDESDGIGVVSWYRDSDGDGFGNISATQIACAQPAGYVQYNTDCDDISVTVFPGAAETCDDVDENCDGLVDNAAIDMTEYYPDADGDGFGDDSAAPLAACDQPDGYVLDHSDCDDGVAGTFPGGAEQCGDGVDNDCDGTTDEGFADDYEPNDTTATVLSNGTAPDLSPVLVVGTYIPLAITLDEAGDVDLFEWEIEEDNSGFTFDTKVTVTIDSVPEGWSATLTSVDPAAPTTLITDETDDGTDGKILLKGGDYDIANELQWSLTLSIPPTADWDTESCIDLTWEIEVK